MATAHAQSNAYSKDNTLGGMGGVIFANDAWVLESRFFVVCVRMSVSLNECKRSGVW